MNLNRTCGCHKQQELLREVLVKRAETCRAERERASVGGGLNTRRDPRWLSVSELFGGCCRVISAGRSRLAVPAVP